MGIRIAKAMAYTVETYKPGTITISKVMDYTVDSADPRPVAPFTRKRREVRQFFP